MPTRVRTALAALIGTIFFQAAAWCQADDGSASLIRLLSDVRSAKAHRYTLRDDAGRSMDCLKVFQFGPGQYAGLYHACEKGIFSVHLARSRDLLTWKHAATLEPHASQATITRATDGSWLVACEKDAPNSCWIRLRHYATTAHLLRAAHDRQRDLPRTLAPTAEGTPSLERVTLGPRGWRQSEIALRFHYFKNAHVDQLASGTLTNFRTWKARPSDKLNTAIVKLGIRGNIGDRDRFPWQGKTYYLQEAQLRRGDWASWRVLLCDHRGMPIQQLPIRTHGGSTAFCNPNATWITDAKAHKLLAVTLFVPSQGAARNEAGSLIYVLQPSAP